MLKLSKYKISKKAQFFIISAVIIVSALTAIQSYFSYSSISFDIKEGNYIFQNTKEQIKKINMTNCEEGLKNLKELKFMTEEALKSKGYELNIIITDNCPGFINVKINLTSSGFTREDKIRLG